MNTKNNKRHQETIRNIERAFFQLLQSRELPQITVSAICKEAGINRSTFYANYLDVYDLAENTRRYLEAEFGKLYAEERAAQKNSNDFLKMFRHIYENQIFYNTYFKLGFDAGQRSYLYDTFLAEELYGNRHIDYHIEFFRSGLNAIIRKWLNSGCRETPEEMAEILASEYAPKAVQVHPI